MDKHIKFKSVLLSGLIVSALALTGCGGGGGGSAATDSPIVAKGVITKIGSTSAAKDSNTGSGSISMNGVEYETPDGGSYSNDDRTDGTASYKVGQVVSVRGTINDDGVSGTADEVLYEAELEGAADSASTINGINIMITDGTTNTSEAPSIVGGVLLVGTRYEVSGNWVGANNSTIEASYVKEDDDLDSYDEIKGKIEAVTTGSITVRGKIYLIDNPAQTYKVNDFVEVHFDPNKISANPDTYNATKVDLEDDYFDSLSDGMEADVEGPVSLVISECPTGAQFKVESTCIKSDSSTKWSGGLTGIADVGKGIRVEAEGYVNADGVLVADKIKGRGNRIRILSTGTGTGPYQFFGKIDVNTSSITEDEGMIIGNLLPADGVEIRGIRTGATSMLATSIQAETVETGKHKLRAEVDKDGVTPTDITIMGVIITVDGNTKLKIEDVLYTDPLDSFLALIDDNGDPADGPNDIVSLKFDENSLIANEVQIEFEDD